MDISDIVAAFALIISVLAFCLNWRTDRKVEHRDLIKERNELLDTALRTTFILQSMKFQLRTVLLHAGPNHTSTDFEESIAEYEKAVQESIDNADALREKLKQGPLTARLIDELSVQIRELHLHHENFAPMVDKGVETMIDITKMTKRLREP